MTQTVRAAGFNPIVAIAGASGFAGLGYEILWTRVLANSLGHEMIAMLGVVAALFSGFALGSLIFGNRIAVSHRPERWYAALELIIGLWAIVLIPLGPELVKLVPVLLPINATAEQQWAVAFGLPALVLLPATLAMGATLPALEAILAPRLQAGGAVSWVYAANTFGAVCGTLLTTFWILPALGLSQTLAVCALINVACAGAMLQFGRPVKLPRSHRSVPDLGHAAAPKRRLISLFLSGLLGIGYEVIAVRALNQIMENTVYTFAALLAVYLFGTALGAALHGRWSKSEAPALAAAASLACVLGTLVLGDAASLWMMLRAMAPQSVFGAALSELGIAAAVFLIPTIAMGALFTQLAQAAKNRDGSLGFALAANTAGAALAPILFGPVLMPLIGAKTALILVALGYAMLAPGTKAREWRARGLAIAATLSLFVTAGSLRFIQVPPGGDILWHRDGVMASVSVVQDRAGDRHLEINNHFRMGGTAFFRSDYREAHIPLLLHPNPHRALFLGLGTGTTMSAAGDHPGLVTDGVELVPEVLESFALFEKSAPNLERNPNMRFYIADARRFIQASRDSYDVIVAEVYHPWIDGAGTLYTREHFDAVRARLAEGGIFCQWLPLHQLDLPTLRIIVRTFLSAFPDGKAYLAQFSIGTPLIGLVGSTSAHKYPHGWLEQRIKDAGLRQKLAALDLTDDMALFGLFLADSNDLARFAGPGALNTDDRQLVTFQAPSAAYFMAESPGARLVSLLSAFHPQAKTILQETSAGGDGEAARLAAYWSARDRYLALGEKTLHAPPQENVPKQLGPQLVDVVRLSADFDPAYRPVLAMAQQLAASDRAAARQLLEDLERASPKRPEAGGLLAMMPAD